MIDRAIAFAATAHAGQKRKYDNLPYIVHPIEVMTIVHKAGGDEAMLVAAILHDVIEDCEVSLETIIRRFGEDVAMLVDKLTDEFTKEVYPTWNRRRRKLAEIERLAGAPARAQTIKYADLISNTRSIVEHDKNFAVRYLEEKAALLDVMNKGDATLYQQALAELSRGQWTLMQNSLRG